MTEKVRKSDLIDWRKWINRTLKDLCDFYVEHQLCEKVALQKDQFKVFYNAVDNVNRRKEEYIDYVINNTPGLKRYLQIHSVFKADMGEHDWFSRKMTYVLEATDDDIKSILYPPRIPQKLLEKFSIFNPEQVSFMVDPIRIEYDFYSKKGPIIVTDLDWEKVKGREVNVENFLSQYGELEVGTNPDNAYLEDMLLF